MSYLESFLLGLVQGLTEFFPVSSSAHLILIQQMLGFDEPKKLIFFDLVCHLGTLGAVTWYFRKEIQETLTSIKQMRLFFIALLPLFPLVFVLKTLENSFNPSHFLSVGFLISSLLLFAGEYVRRPWPTSENRGAFLVGCSQALAIFPGISRSGATISTARVLGCPIKDAVRFSFLLSLPTILGGVVLKLLKGMPEETSVSTLTYLIAFSTSLVSGLLAIRLLYWIIEKHLFSLFAWYCLSLGLLLLFR